LVQGVVLPYDRPLRLRDIPHCAERRHRYFYLCPHEAAEWSGETVMPTLLIAVLAVALMLWLVKSFTRSDPRYLAMILATVGRTAGGVLAVAVASFLLFRGEPLVAVPLGFFGLSLLGWQPGRDLLAAYFDRRSPRWRENVEQDPGVGRRTPPPSGKMTEQEAYQILGLQPGATAEDVTRAHRALIKKLHPDQGGSTYLAARVNDAKDVLLRINRGA
jgi:hypothetical protein